MRRAALVTVAAFAAAVALAAVARAATFEVTTAATEARAGQAEPLTYRIAIRTGDAAERVRLYASGESAFRDFDGEVNGASLYVPTGSAPRYEGDGSMTYAYAVPSPLPPCVMPPLPSTASGGGGAVLLDVDMPGRGQGTVVLDAGVASVALWTGEAYALRITITDGQALAVPAVARGGPSGVRLGITTTPASARCYAIDEARHPRGRVTVTGRSEPPLSGQKVDLLVSEPGADRFRTLATVTAAADGTFSYAWEPRADGVYGLMASYTSQRADLADSRSPARRLELTDPGPPPVVTPPPPAALPRRARIGRSVRVRGGRARVKIACPARSTAACAGSLRLLSRDRRRVLGRTSFSVPAGRRVAVRARLTRSARRRLRRDRRLVALAEIASRYALDRTTVVLRPAR